MIVMARERQRCCYYCSNSMVTVLLLGVAVHARFESGVPISFQRMEEDAGVLLRLEGCTAGSSCGGGSSVVGGGSLNTPQQPPNVLCMDRIGTAVCLDLSVLLQDSMSHTCIRLFGAMRDLCAKSCHVCHEEDYYYYDDDDDDVTNKDVSTSRLYNEVPQQKTPGQSRTEMEALVTATDKYMYDIVYSAEHDETYEKVRFECLNRDSSCVEWALSGECEANPKYMQLSCAPACQTCHMLDMNVRCPFDGKNEPKVWSRPGDLNQMFQRIVAGDPVVAYPTTILSRNPWVVVVDNFLSAEECQVLIEWGAALGYQRSMDVGTANFDGTYGNKVNERRTSTNAWCSNECWHNETTRRIHHRMQLLTQIPPTHYEDLQLLKYEEGQFYETHHDYIAQDVNRFPGPRILTIFLYLNDVEDGGGTDFPQLNLTVIPKQGRVVLWPSVLDEDPMRVDARTQHQALPVKKGIKYGANAWVHQRDFKQAFQNGCA